MPTDEHRRDEFIAYLKQLKLTWNINRETEISIIKGILGHKDSELITYIAYFKNLIYRIKKDINTQLDRYSENPPVDGKCVYTFIGASVNTKNYTSNFALRLFFSNTEKVIYKFEILC